MSGHLFIMRGDLCQLACDDWLLPCAPSRHVAKAWWSEPLNDALLAADAWNGRRHPKGALRMTGHAAIPLDAPAGQPRPWLVDTTGRDPQRTAERARAFIACVAQTPWQGRRARRLIALPIMGTGAGGSYQQAGAVLAELLPALHAAAQEHNVDIALVTASDAHHAAAQALRPHTNFTTQPAALRTAALSLAARARAGQLVLFIGAGVSIGAGLPDWDTLLENLAQQAGLTEDELRRFRAQHALDRAEYIALRLATEDISVGHAVVEALHTEQPRYGLAHGLLAGLPVTESVTTNYDQLFEHACQAAQRPVAVLPHEPAETRGRWLLKMHGCVQHPEDIILTRQNYLRYAIRNAALSGIVQAMLITKHMVFLGFSLRDDNFLRIVDEVRRAVNPGPHSARHATSKSGRLGTALMLDDDPLAASLWTGDLEWLSFDQGDGTGEAARRMEILLDEIGHHATAQAHLLDPRFNGALDENDRALRDLLLPLVQASDAAKNAPAFAHVQRMLQGLGLNPSALNSSD
jgi:NAD-dependent SIR2 family protein deacetylase